MRAVLPAFALLIAAAAAAGSAAPPAKPAPIPYDAEPHRPIRIRISPSMAPRDADLPLRLENEARWDNDSTAASSISIGPLEARLGGTAKRAHIARYKIEGMDVLGASISGTFDGRGARVYVRWPPGDDD